MPFGFGECFSVLGNAFREEVDADDGLEEGALSARLRSHHRDLRAVSGVGSSVECLVSSVQCLGFWVDDFGAPR